MRRIFIFLLFCGICLLCSKIYAQGCVNADFSDGNFSGWTATYSKDQCSEEGNNGKCKCSPTDPDNSTGFNQGPNNDPPNDASNEYSEIITTTAGGNDVNLASLGYNMPTVYPGNAFSARIGNMWQQVTNNKTGDGESISYSFLVNASNCNFIYHYAVVLYSGNHTPGQQAYFNISMTANGSPIACAAYQVDATTAATIGGFSSSDSVFWKPWSSVAVPLYNYIGQTVNITFTTRGCIPNGCAGKHYAYAYIAAECGPFAFHISSQLTCGQNDTLIAPAGFATYSWTGPDIIGSSTGQQVIVNEGGNYIVNMTTFGNTPCPFSIDTIIAGTNPKPDFTVPTVCTGDSVPFQDLSTATGTISSWQWNFGDGTTANTKNPWHTFATAGTYPVTLIITAGPCTKDTTINVTVVAPPTATFSAQSPVCIYTNSYIAYTGNAPPSYTYNWDFDGGINGSDTSEGPFNISWLASGTKTITLQVSFGYCYSIPDTEQVTVKPFPGMQLSTFTSICQGRTATLTADNCTTYQWSPAATLSDTNTATVYATPLATTTYSVTGTSAQCLSVDTVTVYVKDYPTTTFTAMGPVCIGQNSTVIYTGNGGTGSIYNWDFHGGIAMPDIGSGPFLVNWLTPGNHEVTLDISLEGCDTSASDTINVYSSPPHPALTADTSIGCPGLDVCFTSASVGNTIGYIWSFGDGDTSHAQNPCYTYPDSGVFSVSFQVALSPECIYDTTITDLISIRPLPIAAFTPSATVIQQPQSLISFTNQSQGAVSYLWDFYSAYSSANIIGKSTDADPSFNYTTYGDFKVALYAYNQLGCPDSVTKSITVYPPQNFYIPNAFTPNGDGINDEIYIYTQPGATVVSFQIFDRWGEKVHDGPYAWDGTYKGEPCSPGVYVYLATVKVVDNTDAVKCKGSITLIR
jgi:gliding motility-associated-like protein